jgi:phage terminase large subunit
MQLLIMIAMTEHHSISVTSCAFPHLRRGSLRDWRTIMEDIETYDPNKHTKTEQVYHYGKKSYIEFFSVDNNLKVRGPGRDILFINEANLIQFDTFQQLILRTRKCIFVDFNPSDEFSWLYDHVQTRDDCKFIKSTYLDNPFLPHEQVKEIENLKNVDSNFWRIYGEGERGHSEGVIYTHWQTYSQDVEGRTVFGLDFGYNNPAALIKVTEKDQDLYWKQELYQSGLTNSDLIPVVKQVCGRLPVYCDSAEPDRIEEMRRAGINAIPANKNVKEGIDFIKSRKLFIWHGSVELLKEIKSYKYMDQGKKLGNQPEVPLKLNDHGCDGGRYGSVSFKKAKTGLNMTFHR